MSLKNSFVLGSVTASVLLAASMAVHADDASPVQRTARSTSVSFADLNLDRSGAAASLYQRLTKAADKVCSSRAFTSYYYTYADYQNCVANAVQKAVAQIDHPALNAFYQQQLPQSRSARLAIE